MNRILYQSFVDLIESYQANYEGDDKMSREFMMGEIEKFKTEENLFSHRGA